MRAGLRLVAIGGVGSGVLAARLWNGEQLTCSHDSLGTLAAGEQTAVVDMVEAAGEQIEIAVIKS
jgi:hypothetical protein